MKCLRCGSISRTHMFCGQCMMNFNENTALNFNEIKQIEVLIQECDNVKNFIIGNTSDFNNTMEEFMHDANFFFSSLFGKKIIQKLGILSKNKEQSKENIEKTKDLEYIDYIKSRLTYILNQMENGQIIIPKQEKNKKDKYECEITKFDHTKMYNPTEIIVADVYQVLVFIKDKYENKNLILFSNKLNLEPIIFFGSAFETPGSTFKISKDCLPADDITNSEFILNPINKKFIIPFFSLAHITDKNMGQKEATDLLFSHLIDYGINSFKALEELSPQAKIKKLSDKYY